MGKLCYFFKLNTTTDVTISYNFKQNGAQADSRAGVDNFKIEMIDQATSDLSWNWTGLIANPSIEKGTEGSFAGYGSGWANKPVGFSGQLEMGWTDGSINDTNPKDGSHCYNLWSNTYTSSNIYQDVILPKGKYTISAALRIDNMDYVTDQGVYAKVGENTYKSGTITSVAATWNSVEGWNTLEKVFYVTEDNTNVRLGVSSTGTGSGSKGWYQLDNFTLTYHGSVATMATTFEMGTATDVLADTWYSLSIPTTGDYKITSTAPTTIYYTQTGYHSAADATANETLSAGDNVVNFSRGTLYFRSTDVANLTIVANSYHYNINSASADIEYVQKDKIVTVTWDIATNDPGATFEKNGTPSITFGGNAVEVTPTATGFTFVVPTVTANSDYTLSIPDDAFVYTEGATFNVAQDILLHTPAVFDGTYYIKQNDEDKYISRGGDSNTEAVLDNYGIAVKFITDASNVTHIQFVDNDKNLFGGSQTIYTDKNESDLGENAARARWTVASVSGGYTLYCGTWSKYIKEGTGAESGKPAATYDENPYTWVLESLATHATKMAALKDANAAAVATAAGISATTVDALKTAISGYTTSDITVTNAYSDVTEKWQPGGYAETIIAEQELTGLESGIYKVTLSAFHRMRGNAETYALHQNNSDATISYLYANDQQVQLPSVMSEYSNSAYTGGWDPNYEVDGKNYPNNTTNAGQAFDAGRYKVELFAFVNNGTLKIGLKDPGKYNNYNWICYRDLAVTRYYPSVVSKTIDATLGWATYCSPYALDFSSDIANLTGAYLVTGGADGQLALSKITGDIPAKTGILLEGSGEVNIPVVASSSTNVSSNKLIGVTSETSGVAAGIYVLLYGTDDTSGPVGFYKTANAFTISANTAYLPADFTSGVTPAREAYFFDGVTGVDAVEAASKAIVKEGKFIENGKLVIFKKGMKFNANGQIVK